MPPISITAAWNESADFLKRHFGALFTVAVALIALPNVALQTFAPASAAAGEVPKPGLWLVFLALAILVGFVGSIAISTLALGRKSVVGEAIAHAFRRLPAMVGAALIVVAGILLVLVPLVLALGIRPDHLVAPTPATAGRILIALLVMLALGLFVAVRLLLMTPVAAAEPAGPLAIIRRSWTLTAGHFWKLLGFVLLMTLAVLVVMAVATLVLGVLLGLILGPPTPGTAGGFVVLLVGGLVNAAFVVVMTTMVARLYLQLAGRPSAAAD